MALNNVTKWAAFFALVITAGCGLTAKQNEISRYRLEIKNGVERAFPDESRSGNQESPPYAEHYVSPQGTASNDGTINKPWDLRTALSHPKSIRPGDIIWLRGGVYKGAFISQLIGRSGMPIVVRQYPGDRVTVDGCTNPPTADPTLSIKGEYTWYWGFEVTNCRERRATTVAGSGIEDRGGGIDLSGTDVKLINLVIHDTGGGIAAWMPAKRAELSGNIVYYNGWDGPDRGHGHGIYVQNEHGMKVLSNNVVFSQFGSGIHAYAEKGYVNNLILEGNIVFLNGALSERSGFSRNLLIGGQHTAAGLNLTGNSTYYPLSGGGANMIGYGVGCNRLVLTDNYFAGPDALTINKCTDIEIKGNAFVGTSTGFPQFEYRENEYRPKPSGTAVELRPDRWEEGRAYLAVYNWDGKVRLLVDLARLGWKAGQRYKLRNVQNYFEEAQQGTYDGESIEVPMTGWTVAQPVGKPAPRSTFPEFGAFVLETDDFPRSQTSAGSSQSAAQTQ